MWKTIQQTRHFLEGIHIGKVILGWSLAMSPEFENSNSFCTLLSSTSGPRLKEQTGDLIGRLWKTLITLHFPNEKFHALKYSSELSYILCKLELSGWERGVARLVMVTSPNHRRSHMHPAINRENAPDPITSYGGKLKKAKEKYRNSQTIAL